MLNSEFAWMHSLLRQAYASAYSKARQLAARWVTPDSPLGPLVRSLGRALRPVSRRKLDVLLEAFARGNPRAVFVQIGSNDGAQQDPLREVILKRRWRGVMVEPVPYVFERLKANYGHLIRIRLENVAIAEADGTKPFFHLPKVDRDDRDGLPEWYDALGSFSREVVASHRVFIPDIEHRIACTEVPTLTFESLCRKAGFDQIDLLHIDTEGFDYEIIKRIDLDRWQPQIIIYEHHHLGAARAECETLLRSKGYDLAQEALDTWALRVEGPSAVNRGLLDIWQRLKRGKDTAGRATGFMVRGVDPVFEPLFRFEDDDLRRLNAAYDDRTPAPLGASVALSPNSPRLDEIRRRYAGLDLPALARSQWNPSRVNEQLDLLNFRGDNPYVWHYRELPRATRLKYFLYLDYLQKRDTLGLFSKLHEDGMFGCWTHEYDGRPRISRDLLDSISEILFLDRRLSITAANQLRVLDIGAGYGRLAHRMVTAIPTMSDYCCVDAIPESSFLCEFYTRQRGVAPPARVVLLDEVDTALTPGGFDLAINVHSFSECPQSAVAWWLEHLRRLNVPRLFIVPNEAEGLLSSEADGSKCDLLPLIAHAGYRLECAEKAIDDPAVRDLLQIEDNFLLFGRS